MSDKVLPTKKQRELLTYIAGFIEENGYSPSYREIMNALEYNSVATVAVHVNNLISRGHLRKRDRSARSLEVITDKPSDKVLSNQIKPAEEKWFVEKVEHFVSQLEQQTMIEPAQLSDVDVLVSALKILGLEGAAQSFVPRIGELKKRLTS